VTDILYAKTRPVVIEDGATESGVLRIESQAIIGIVTPASFEGTRIKFQVSHDNATYYTLTDPDDGNDVAIVAASSEAYAVDHALTRAWKFVKLVAGTAQTGDATLQVTTMPLVGN
jgi:hypothetical protein